MKAVYEMPKVSFEEFAPNMAIAGCGVDTTAAFNCLYGPLTEEYSVMSDQVGISGCKNQCGFIDYTGDQAGADFLTAPEGGYTTTGFQITANSNSHTRNNEWVTWDTVTEGEGYHQTQYSVATITESWMSKFAGWLYIAVSKNTQGYTNVKVDGDGTDRITLSSDSKHLEFLPLFSSNPTSY